MSLNFSFEKVTPPADMTLDQLTSHPTRKDEWHPVADSLVWLSLICGFNKITQDNLADVTRRIVFYQKLYGAYLQKNGRPVYINDKDVAMFVGLSTNVTPETETKWYARTTKHWRERERAAFAQDKSAYELTGS